MKNFNEKEYYEVTEKDLKKVFVRSLPLEWSWNYIKQQNMGFSYAIIPMLEKIYDNEEDRIDAYKRHLEFFNITPWLSTIPMGITLAMEEARAKDIENFDTSSINNIKVALMGPLSGIGDSMFWGTLRIIATAVSIGFALEGNIFGPILFLVLFNVPALLIRWYGLKYSYKFGESFIEKIQVSNLMQKLTYGATVLGLFVIGSMAGSLVRLNVPLVLGSGENAQTISEIANTIVPNLLPLLSVFGIYWLVKKNVKAQYILLIVITLSIIGAFFGILG